MLLGSDLIGAGLARLDIALLDRNNSKATTGDKSKATTGSESLSRTQTSRTESSIP